MYYVCLFIILFPLAVAMDNYNKKGNDKGCKVCAILLFVVALIFF